MQYVAAICIRLECANDAKDPSRVVPEHVCCSNRSHGKARRWKILKAWEFGVERNVSVPLAAEQQSTPGG